MTASNAIAIAKPPRMRWLPLPVGIGFFALYWFTLSPGVFPGESASLLATTLGVEPNLSPDHPFWRIFFSAQRPWRGCANHTPTDRPDSCAPVAFLTALATKIRHAGHATGKA